MQTLANHDTRDKSATVKPKPINIIMGSFRVCGANWLDVLDMIGNGKGLIRDGNAYRLISSEAFEQLEPS
jgi:hypothetical protein